MRSRLNSTKKETTADKALFIAIPARSSPRVEWPATRREMMSTASIASIAPINASGVTAPRPNSVNRSPSNRAIAAPRLAPDDTPSTKESAKLFCNSPCMMAPAVAKAAPTAAASSALGNLNRQAITASTDHVFAGSVTNSCRA